MSALDERPDALPPGPVQIRARDIAAPTEALMIAARYLLDDKGLKVYARLSHNTAQNAVLMALAKAVNQSVTLLEEGDE